MKLRIYVRVVVGEPYFEVKEVLVFIPTWNGIKLEETLNSIPSYVNRVVFPNKDFNWALSRTWNYALEKYGDSYETIIISNDDVLFRGDTCDLLHVALHRRETSPKQLVVTTYDTQAHGDAGEVWFTGLQDLAGWFCFATSKALTEEVGWFDEHFFPAYYEDADMEHRIRCAGFETYIHTPVLHYGGQTTKNDKEREKEINKVYFKLYQLYFRMWGGGPLGDEHYCTKFNGKLPWVEKLHSTEQNKSEYASIAQC